MSFGRMILAAKLLQISRPGCGEGEKFELPASGGETLAQAIWLAGAWAPGQLCAGLGRCGRCRVRFTAQAPNPGEAENVFFDPAQLARGWRLACRHRLRDLPDLICLELPEASGGIQAEFRVPRAPGAGQPAVVALDLGTSSIAWQSLEASGASVAGGALANPQIACGSDVISRLAAAARQETRSRMAGLARGVLARIVAAHRQAGWSVERVCVAANTVMTDILLERDLTGLSRAPFRLSHSGNETFQLLHLPPIYVPPLPAPFIGSDISAGLLALLDANVPAPFILADMGTNGEFVLFAGPEKIFMLSVPLGPALEGQGMECGALAGEGVATAFRLGPTGLQALSSAGSPAGAISATGYISLLACLLRVRAVSPEGRLQRPAGAMGRILGDFDGQAEDRIALPGGGWISAADVQELLKVKAAFSLALASLMQAAGLTWSGLKALCLGGALGEHVAASDLAALGFIPPLAAGRLRAVGNSSLKGAAIMALQPARGEEVAALFRRAVLLDLAQRPDFLDLYMQHMKFGA